MIYLYLKVCPVINGIQPPFVDDKEAGAGSEDANETLDKSLNIADIDARLSALQMFMKSNLDDM